ncbi:MULTISPECIES: DUF982 domain-containing protein [unclassified Ochrobactrum]|uniref:DUF982 domain-containing protein n=1 Tax=unclassified Ochrobactrum TaxID=239106 RepID=UPI000DD4FBFE|nr:MULTISPECIES: DUF982 domain-containing protein [unclassified Ochrobactrum]MBQ0710397.1 DUF982 domain-containing protein [Ochrobactrum sp. AP1BH01-1]
MSDRLFDSPVFVKDGPYLIQEIAGIEDAIDFLNEWPEHDRDVIYEMTWKVCCDAQNGLKPLYVARHAIAGFARKRNILEQPETAIPWMIAPKAGGGRVPV